MIVWQLMSYIPNRIVSLPSKYLKTMRIGAINQDHVNKRFISWIGTIYPLQNTLQAKLIGKGVTVIKCNEDTFQWYKPSRVSSCRQQPSVQIVANLHASIDPNTCQHWEIYKQRHVSQKCIWPNVPPLFLHRLRCVSTDYSQIVYYFNKAWTWTSRVNIMNQYLNIYGQIVTFTTTQQDTESLFEDLTLN